MNEPDPGQRREDAWAVLKQMHDDLADPSARRARENALLASGGWCAPSTVLYATGGTNWSPGVYQANPVIQVGP